MGDEKGNSNVAAGLALLDNARSSKACLAEKKAG
jgi:hypothetical protein